jgi:hypothetical protein
LFKIANTSVTWSKVKLNFLASTRNDIDIGTASLTSPNYKSNKFTIEYLIQKQYANSSSLKAKVFIQSLNVESVDKQFVGIYLKGTTITTKSVLF